MEPLKDVFKIIRQGVWMVSVDLKDAFFPVSVHKSHQKYFESFEAFINSLVCQMDILKQ